MTKSADNLPSPQNNKKLGLIFMSLSLFFGLIALVLLLNTTFRQPYTIFDNGEQIAVRGSAGTVGDLLERANIELREEDWVVPARDSEIGTESAVFITRANPITISSAFGEQTIYTPHKTISAVLRSAGIVARPSDTVLADGQAVPFTNLTTTEVADSVNIQQINPITIVDGVNMINGETAVSTVADALAEADIELFAADGVEPSLGSWIQPNMQIRVIRAKPLTIFVDGRKIETRSFHANARDVLADNGIGLVGFDYVRPASDVQLQPNDAIYVVRVAETVTEADTSVPFETLWQGTDQLEIDVTGLVSAGTNGVAREQVSVRTENGQEIGRYPAGSYLAKNPINQVMGFGTNIVVRTLDTPDGPVEYWRNVRMRVTAYTAATSGKSRDHPAYGITRSGLLAGKGIVAVDPTVVPFLSDVYVEGYGRGKAGDTGGGVLGRWIDLGYDEDNFVSWWGYTDVYHLTPIPERDKINFRIPTYLP